MNVTCKYMLIQSKRVLNGEWERKKERNFSHLNELTRISFKKKFRIFYDFWLTFWMENFMRCKIFFGLFKKHFMAHVHKQVQIATDCDCYNAFLKTFCFTEDSLIIKHLQLRQNPDN